MNFGRLDYKGYWSYVYYYPKDDLYIIDYIEYCGHCWIQAKTIDELRYAFKKAINNIIIDENGYYGDEYNI